VSYVANSSSFSGQDIEPQVLTNEPSAGKTTLIWPNLSDLSPNSQAKLTYQVQASTSTYADGGSYTESQSAYVNTSPRTAPSFTAARAPVSSSYTGSATATGPTTLSAIQVTSSDAAGAKLLRSVHTHQTVYTLTVANNGVKPTTSTVLDAYLPAGLEFLGCGTSDNTTCAATNPGSTEEWPGSGALSGRTANPGNCSGYTEVQTGNFTPGNGIPSGFYTHVGSDSAS
jgi:large repetitive protein